MTDAARDLADRLALEREIDALLSNQTRVEIAFENGTLAATLLAAAKVIAANDRQAEYERLRNQATAEPGPAIIVEPYHSNPTTPWWKFWA